MRMQAMPSIPTLVFTFVGEPIRREQMKVHTWDEACDALDEARMVLRVLVATSTSLSETDSAILERVANLILRAEKGMA